MRKLFVQVRSWTQRHHKALYPFLDGLGFVVLYIYLIVAGNRLTPMAFGQLNSLSALYGFLGAIGVSVQYIVARRIAKDGERANIGELFALSMVIAAIVSVPFLIPLPRDIQLDAVWLVGSGTLALLIAVSTAISFMRGIIQGQERFIVLWMAQMTAHVLRLGCFLAMSEAQTSLQVAWVAIILGEVGHLIFITCVLARGEWRSLLRMTDRNVWRQLPEMFGVYLANLGLLFLLSVDVVLAAEFLGVESGPYATANRYGRLLYFVGASVAIVLLPQFAKRALTRRVLFQGWLVAAAVTPVLSFIGAMVASPTMYWFFPESLVPSIGLISWEFGANFGLAVCHILVTWHIAQERKWYVWILGFWGAVTTGVLIFGPSTGFFYAQSTAVLFWVAACCLAWFDVPLTLESAPNGGGSAPEDGASGDDGAAMPSEVAVASLGSAE